MTKCSRAWLGWMIVVMALGLTGCPPEDESILPAVDMDPAPEADAGPDPDAAPAPDAAQDPMPDAAPTPDAAVEPDAAPEPDMGVEPDAEIELDAEPEGDAEVEPEGDAEVEPEADEGVEPDPDADVEPDADPEPGICIGPDPLEAEGVPPADPEDDCVTCPGAPAPEWALVDFQPQSCGLDQTYGLGAFVGQVTLMATFNAGCGFCQAQAEALEQMRFELELEGTPAWFVAVNSASNLEFGDRLIERCSYPLLQDTDEVDVWGIHSGGVSDFYLYDETGHLVQHYDQSAIREERGRSLTLSNEEDYAELKQAIIDVIVRDEME